MGEIPGLGGIRSISWGLSDGLRLLAIPPPLLAMASKSSRPSGFSLLQVLLLLLGLGVTASMAIPAWFSQPAVTLDSAALLLARDLRWAQDRAAFEGQVVELHVDADRTGYRVVDEHGLLLDAPLGPRGFVRDYDVDAVFRGVRLEGDGAVARFDASGRAERAMEFELCFEGATRVLRVEAPFGRILIEGLTRDWQDPAF